MTLQERILDTLAQLEQLRDSDEYELYRLSQASPDFLQEIAAQQAQQIAAEVAGLETEAERLAAEIENLTGSSAPFRD